MNQVIFLEMPVVDRKAVIIINGQEATTSEVANIVPDANDPLILNVYTVSGVHYVGRVHSSNQTSYSNSSGFQPPPPQTVNISFGSFMKTDGYVPPEIKNKLNWGAMLLAPFWSASHNVWIGLLSIIPSVGLIMSLILLFKGNEWGWQNRKFESVDHFKAVQNA